MPAFSLQLENLQMLFVLVADNEINNTSPFFIMKCSIVLLLLQNLLAASLDLHNFLKRLSAFFRGEPYSLRGFLDISL